MLRILEKVLLALLAVMVAYTLVLMTAGPVDAGVRTRDFGATWFVTGAFGTVDAQCSMQCLVRVKDNGAVKPGSTCVFTMADAHGGTQPTVERVKVTGGQVEVAGKYGKRYAVFAGTVTTETLDFSFDRLMLMHNSQRNRQAIDLGTVGAGVVRFSNGAVGAVTIVRSSRGGRP